MAREDDSDSRPLGTTPQRVHFGGHRNTCRCALFSREKVNQKSSLGKYHLWWGMSIAGRWRARGILCLRSAASAPVSGVGGLPVAPTRVSSEVVAHRGAVYVYGT